MFFFAVYLTEMSLFGKIVATTLFLLTIGIVILFFLYTKINTAVQNFDNANYTQIVGQAPKDMQATNSASMVDLQKELKILQASSQAQLARIEVLEKAGFSAQTVSSGIKQVFQKQIVHIGSASTTQTDWTNTGVEVTLNSADYPTGVNATFEAGLSIVGGEAWARLVNKTTGAIMTVTEVFAASSTTVWKSSPHFKLFAGTNVYEVQVKSSSGEVANISSARIILTN